MFATWKRSATQMERSTERSCKSASENRFFFQLWEGREGEGLAPGRLIPLHHTIADSSSHEN